MTGIKESTASTVSHGKFVIERRFDFAPATVFAAFADPAQKRRWFVEGEGWTIDGYEADFRGGGFEKSRFRFGGGDPMGNDTLYVDIVENRRIVFAYSMTMKDKAFSASVATIELQPEGKGTLLVYTEQVAHLDGVDSTADRESGCRDLFEALDAVLRKRAAS